MELLQFDFVRMFFRWFFTVSMEMNSFDAISRDDNPLIISEMISLSRLENAFREKSESSS